ncbi:hypothetical protein [Nocardia sp. NBC_00416]|uniref:hypothetical protein n=1 Tax=Nocardia sp. NBC_00416 TaxID=2975991 RepID=UPI002E239F4D
MKRAVALLHTAHAPAEFEALVQQNSLQIVYTVRTDARAALAALIAVQYALERVAEAVVIPHLGSLEPDAPWWVITGVAELITGARTYPRTTPRTAFGAES